ncbi:MAG: hypothetical protein ABF289_08490 [Clostridiales bacterium]
MFEKSDCKINTKYARIKQKEDCKRKSLLEVSYVLADNGCDIDKIINYIYENGGELIILSKTNQTVQRKCD